MRSKLPPSSVLRRELSGLWPGGGLRRWRVDNSGWTNLMLEADGRIMFRIPRWAGSARSLHREVQLLELLEKRLSATVPRPLVVGSLDRPAGWPFMAYLKIEGTPLANLFSLSRTDRDRLVEFLTRLLRELSEVPLGPLRSLGIEAGDASSWATRYRRLLRRYSRVGAKHVRSRLDDAIRRRFREFFLALEDSRYRPVLSHGDLWPSHVLWNDRLRRPVAVIDWEDARLGDPAFDLTAFADLGPEAGSRLASVRKSPRDSRFVERLLFYRRILPLPGLLYGIETGRRSLARQHLAQLSRSLELENTG